jgi:hypothetical protein
VKKSFNIQETSTQGKSKHHETKPMHPSKNHETKANAPLFVRGELSKETQESNLKHPGWVDLISTKGN